MKSKADGTQQTALDFIRDIIVKEMKLDPERVNIFNQAWKIPTYEGLFILVDSKGSPKTIANRSAQSNIYGVGYSEVQSVNTQEIISINIMSRDNEAVLRKEEILMAINSIYAQQVQEENSFRIANISPITNLSDLEGSAVLTRFEVSLVVFSWFYKTKTVDYYDSFTGQVKTEELTVDFVQNTQ